MMRLISRGAWCCTSKIPVSEPSGDSGQKSTSNSLITAASSISTRKYTKKLQRCTVNMKIAFVLDDRLDKPDGAQQCVRILGSWLSRHGHEVHYIVGATKTLEFPNIHVAARNLPVRFNGNRLTIPLPT